MNKHIENIISLGITFLLFLGLGILALDALEVESAKPIAKVELVTYSAPHPSTKSIATPVISKPDRELVGDFKLTFYDDDIACCGNTDGITKSGAHVQEGVTIAVDPNIIPLGTEVYIEGYGYRTAQDTGGAIDGKRIDIYVSTHKKALELGIKYAKVYTVTNNE